LSQDTFNFDPEYENLVIASYIAAPDKFVVRGELLKSNYFSSVVSSLTMECLTEYNQKYGCAPSWEVMNQLMEDKYVSVDQDPKPVREYLKKLRALDTNHTDFVVDRLVHFCKQRAIIAAVKKVARDLRDGNQVDGSVISLFEDATSIGENLSEMGYIFHHAVDSVIDKVLSPSFGVRTGLPQLDNIWKTGWAPGWLITLLAPPKRYKTTVAMNIALSIVGPAVGEDVIYYACEISEEQAVLKGFYNITGVTEDSMFESPDRFKENVREAMKNKIAGNLVIKHFPIGTATVGGTLRAHTRMLMKQLGIRPKLIVIDYADTVNPVAKGGDDKAYILQANVYKEAIAMGKEANCAVLMPDRLTAEAAEQKVPVKRVFQGAFAKGGIVDAALVLCQTPTEYQKNILRTFVFINRHGPAFQYFQGTVDPAINRVNLGDAIEYNPDEAEEAKAEGRQRRTSNRGPGLPEELGGDGAT
jgi:hypothetical protein